MLIVYFRCYLAAEDLNVAEFVRTASQGILPTEISGIIDHTDDRVGIGRLERCWTNAGFADVWDDLHFGWVDMFESFRPQTISPQAASSAYILASANAGQSSRPQDQIIFADLTVEALGSWAVRDATLQRIMLDAGEAADVDLSLRIFDQCKQATYAMHPDVRVLMNSLLAKQDDLDPHRIKLVDGIPNCPDAECLHRVLTRTQKVWNDFGGRQVTRPEKQEKNDDNDDTDDDDTTDDTDDNDEYFDGTDDDDTADASATEDQYSDDDSVEENDEEEENDDEVEENDEENDEEVEDDGDI